MTKRLMDISSLSEQELSSEISKLVGGSLDTKTQNTPINYLEDMNALMPLVFKHRICLNHSTCLDLPTGNVYANDLNDSIQVMTFENAPRALAECLLRVLLSTTEE